MGIGDWCDLHGFSTALLNVPVHAWWPKVGRDSETLRGRPLGAHFQSPSKFLWPQGPTRVSPPADSAEAGCRSPLLQRFRVIGRVEPPEASHRGVVSRAMRPVKRNGGENSNVPEKWRCILRLFPISVVVAQIWVDGAFAVMGWTLVARLDAGPKRVRPL